MESLFSKKKLTFRTKLWIIVLNKNGLVMVHYVLEYKMAFLTNLYLKQIRFWDATLTSTSMLFP